jgi:hypothetical protein
MMVEAYEKIPEQAWKEFDTAWRKAFVRSGGAYRRSEPQTED